MPKPTKKIVKRRNQAKKPNWCSMVVRVSVPLQLVKKLKVDRVLGRDPDGWQYDLEILSAYFDYKDQPSAL